MNTRGEYARYSQTDQHNYAPAQSRETTAEQTIIQAAKIQLLVTVQIGLIGSLAAMVGHHFFLARLDGQSAEAFSQFWIKTASNAFSHVVVMFIGLVVTSLLAQAVSLVEKIRAIISYFSRCGSR